MKVLDQTFTGQADFFHQLVPEYIGRTYRPFVATIRPWDPAYCDTMQALYPERAGKRIAGYLIPEELDRVRRKLTTKDNASIRFGLSKSGNGYRGERGDFCLIGGSVRDSHLAVFYRRLELIGGFCFDMCVLNQLAKELGLTWKSVQVFAVQADVFASRAGSGEKERLYNAVLGKVFPK